MPKYDADTVARWKGSIAKWEGIVAGTYEDHGAEDCPLCPRFSPIELWFTEDDCVGCPVKDATGHNRCVGTPYQDFYDTAPDTPDERAAAQRMLDFLRGLNVEEE